MIHLDIEIDEESSWARAEVERYSAQAVGALVVELGDDSTAHGQVAALFTTDDAVRTLNREWRDKDKPTNVLSFPAGDVPTPEGAVPWLGDLALADETCRREAQEKGIPLGHHTIHLVVHGLLHLLGYDHIEEQDAVMMEGIERAVLARLSIPNPYE